MSEIVVTMNTKMFLKQYNKTELFSLTDYSSLGIASRLNDQIIFIQNKNTTEYLPGYFFYKDIYEPTNLHLRTSRAHFMCIPSLKTTYVVDVNDNNNTIRQFKYKCKVLNYTCDDNKIIHTGKYGHTMWIAEEMNFYATLKSSLNFDFNLFLLVDKYDKLIYLPKYFMKDIKISNSVKSFADVNVLLEMDKRTSLPQSNVRDIGSFINPRYGVKQTKTGGKYKKNNKRKTRKRTHKN
jgi:hypothetical protein